MKKFKMSLAEKRPDVWKIWHPTKNGEVKPDEVAQSSRTKYWFLCKESHEWDTTAYNISDGTGCPTCAGKTVTIENCLATVKPEIAKQWHPEKNGVVTPYDVTAHTNKKVWWLCPRGHSYESPPNSRKNVHSGCSSCVRELQTSFSEQAIYYYVVQVFPDALNRYKIKSKDNKLYEVDIFIPSLRLGIEYDGIFHRNSKSMERDLRKNEALQSEGIKLVRFREGSLPVIKTYGAYFISLKNDSNKELTKSIEGLFKYILSSCNLNRNEIKTCTNLSMDVDRDSIDIMDNYIELVKKNSLAEKFPELAKQWDHELNKSLKPEHFTAHTRKKVWWKCEQGHRWKTAILNRTTNGYGCKYCAGQSPTEENNLATRYPNIAIQWDFKKNGGDMPSNNMPGSSKKVWWLCPKEHSYDMRINKKVKGGTNCPVCSGRKRLVETSLGAKHKQIASEWNYEKNTGTPYDYAEKTSKAVWWRCSIEHAHEWESPINKRTIRGDGCPFCSGKRVTEKNSLEYLNPKLAKEWHPTKNLPLTPKDVRLTSVKAVWWLCNKCTYEWEAVIKSRTINGKVVAGCPECSTRKASPSKNLATEYPDLINDWDYNKNAKNPNEYVKGSSIKVWWKCKNNHEEEEQIRYRVRRNGCKKCKKLKM